MGPQPSSNEQQGQGSTRGSECQDMGTREFYEFAMIITSNEVTGGGMRTSAEREWAQGAGHVWYIAFRQTTFAPLVCCGPHPPEMNYG